MQAPNGFNLHKTIVFFDMGGRSREMKRLCDLEFNTLTVLEYENLFTYFCSMLFFKYREMIFLKGTLISIS